MRISDWSSDVCSSDLGQFRTVDTGIGAVEQRHRHIHDRKTERSLRHRVANTLLDGRNPLLGHCAAGDLLVKAKAFAARERLQLDHHIAELPMPARLLLVPPPLGYGLSSRFAIADTELPAIHPNPLAPLPPVWVAGHTPDLTAP